MKLGFSQKYASKHNKLQNILVIPFTKNLNCSKAKGAETSLSDSLLQLPAFKQENCPSSIFPVQTYFKI